MSMPHSVRLAAMVTAVSISSAAFAQVTGPSTGSTPYITPVAPGVITQSILTVGESVNNKPGTNTPYVMVGIPDGLGGFDNGDGTFTLLMDHELGSTAGVVRAHGSIGSFVSQWTIDRSTLAVTNIKDLIQSAVLTSGTNTFNRFCSADMPAVSAYFNAATGLGTQNRIFMSGEETTGGRAFAHVVTGTAAGTSYQVASLGTANWENIVANPGTGNTTVVAGTSDTSGGKIILYSGTKTNTGTDIQKAGLTGGTAYQLKVASTATEDRTNALGSSAPSFTSAFTAVTDGTGTGFLRPEDVSWDSSNPNDLYFVTTDRYDQVKDGKGSQVGRSRLWRARFNDASDLTTGGTITALLDGTEAQNMMDNLTVVPGIDGKTRVLIQEDVGGQDHNGKILLYEPDTDTLTTVAQHDVARFGDLNTAATLPFNNDEESSGIIDARDLLTLPGVNGVPGLGWFLLDVQAHYLTGNPETVEGGQLLAVYIPQAVPEPASVGLLGLGAVALLRRRRR